TLSRYIVYTSKYIASGPKYLTGARHFLQDLYPDFDANRAHPLVQATIRGSKKIRADPVPSAHHTWRPSLKFPSAPANTMIFCSSSFLHAASMHVILPENSYRKNQKALMDWRKIIKRGSLHFRDGCAGYHLPYHQGDPFYRGNDILFTEQDIAKPICLLRDYAIRRDRLFPFRTELFLREDGLAPTRSWFDKKFFAVLSRDFGGHSPRAGSATFYLSEDIIQALGRWSSQAWKIYIRENPSIRAEQLASLRLHRS
ncbi:hypothetical protein B0H13DRAFT_1592198, partial [Mycena leptocephala]